jgi:WD40 repeat protein
MKRNGELVQIKDIKSGETWELDTVKNQIGLADKPDGLKIDLPGKEPIILRRNGKEMFSISRVPKVGPNPASPESSESSAEISRDAIPVAGREPTDIVQVAFSPDGRYYLAAARSPGSSMGIYDSKTGKRLAQFSPVQFSLPASWSGGAFSPDGTKVLSWSYASSSLYVWDSFSNLRLLHTLAGHKEAISNGAFSPDGKLIVSGSQDHSLIIWDAITGKKKRILEGHTDDCGGCFSPDGKWIVSTAGGDDSSIRVWDAATGKEIWKQAGPGLNDFRLSKANFFSPDGLLLLSLQVNSVRIWEIATGKEVATLKGPADLIGASFLPDGRHLASWGKDKRLRIWNLANSKEVRNLDLGEDLKESAGPSVEISPDGRLLLTAHDGTVRLRELATGRELHSYQIVAKEARSMAFSPDSRLAVVGTSRSNDRSIMGAWVYLYHLPEPPFASKP